jgi:hypothetical protein
VVCPTECINAGGISSIIAGVIPGDFRTPEVFHQLSRNNTIE